MVKNAVRALFNLALLLAYASSWAVTGAAGANISAQHEPTVIPGEYLVLFKARESVAVLEGRDRTVAVAMMLEIRRVPCDEIRRHGAEYLQRTFGIQRQGMFLSAAKKQQPTLSSTRSFLMK